MVYNPFFLALRDIKSTRLMETTKRTPEPSGLNTKDIIRKGYVILKGSKDKNRIQSNYNLNLRRRQVLLDSMV